MQTLNDVHHQFASFFKQESLQPYAWLVSKKLSEGHICLTLDELEQETENLPATLKAKLGATEQLVDEPLVSVGGKAKQPFVLFNRRLYLQRYFNYETAILNRIGQFIADEEAVRADRLSMLAGHRDMITGLFSIEKTTGSTSNWQLAAAISSVVNNFSIITGGPGTGKTTTVAKILAILFGIDKMLKVALAAPTGKAAMRMAESLKNASFSVDPEIKAKFQSLEPSTIHRLLKPVPDSPYFNHNRKNPLRYDVLIIDESSMIDVALFAKLLDAVGTQTRLILLGDKDQLASVEAGSLFGDLCQAQGVSNRFSAERLALINSFAANTGGAVSSEHLAENMEHPLFEHVVELQHSHRFNSDEGIGKFSKAVIRNDEAAIRGFFGLGDDGDVLLDTEYSLKMFEAFADGYLDYIDEPDLKKALAKLNNLRILCAIREAEQGLYASNRKVEKYLSDKRHISLKGEFYEHRPVIMNSNNYSLGLFNGDIGIVRADKNGVMKVWFETADGDIKPVLPGLIGDAETVYAMTIHKSQGSEFNRVLIMLPDTDGISILTRELLYTGITRARQQVLIQGRENGILHAAAAQVKRASGLSERLKQSKDILWH